MNMSTGVNVFLAAVVREKGIPFQLNTHTATPIKEGIGVLEDSSEEYKSRVSKVIEDILNEDDEIFKKLVDLWLI